MMAERRDRIPQTQWINRCANLQNARDSSRNQQGRPVACAECVIVARFLGEKMRRGNVKMSFLYEGGKGRCIQVWEQLSDLSYKAQERELTVSEQERASALVEEAMELGLIQ